VIDLLFQCRPQAANCHEETCEVSADEKGALSDALSSGHVALSYGTVFDHREVSPQGTVAVA